MKTVIGTVVFERFDKRTWLARYEDDFVKTLGAGYFRWTAELKARRNATKARDFAFWLNCVKDHSSSP